MKRRVGRPKRPAIVRAAALEATSTILREAGLRAVTMRRVAAKLGVTPMALYHHFGTVETLLAEVSDAVFATLDVPPATGWRDRVEVLAAAYVDLVARHGELFRHLIARAETVPDLVRAMDARLDDAFGNLEVRPYTKQAIVDFLHGFAFGVPTTGLTSRHATSLRRELAVLLDGARA